ncbi:MAG: molybdopterin cofactor-binding domain-containing protein [Candidatus Acidiferrales bacterium]
MSRKVENSVAVEPERYEFRESPAHHFELQRRDFFKAVGAGVAVLVVLKANPLAAQESGRANAESIPQNIGAWLHIGEDGLVTVYTGKVEIGQNIRTSLAQSVAEELRVSVDKIYMEMGDTAKCPFDMGTFGSRTTPYMGPQLRKAASSAKDILLNLAAQKWNVDRAQLVVADGEISDPKNHRRASYAELARGQQFAEVIPAEDPLTPATAWTVAGTSARKVDGRDFVTGRHRYSSDMGDAGTLHGKIVRPAAFGAKLQSVDASAAKAMPGVAVVLDGDFIGIAAPSELLAARAAKAIRAEWTTPPAQPSNKDIFDYLRTHAGHGAEYDTEPQHLAGSIEAGLAAASIRLQQTYTAAYIAHTPLEPRAAMAEWKDGGLTVYTGTQRPFAVRGELMQAFHLSEDKVRVIVPDTGSAYGGKHTGECAIEAARLARAAGKPVRVVWSREEEFTWAYFRPAALIEISSGVGPDGLLTAWEFHNYNSGTSAITTPYEVVNQKIQFHGSDSPLRQGSYRGLAATANHFARESHMDELAHHANLDPLEFRLRNLKDARLRAVFKAAAKSFGWGNAKTAPGQQGFGIAGGVEKGGYVATCAEVRVEKSSGDVRVERLLTAFECGAIVNPDHLRNQIEGSMMMGLGGALFEAVEFADGRILNPHFAQYRVPRFGDAPRIEVVLVDRKDLQSAGAGETPLVGTAPAIGNAIFDATGIRLRSMPLVPNGLKPPAA